MIGRLRPGPRASQACQGGAASADGCAVRTAGSPDRCCIRQRVLGQKLAPGLFLFQRQTRRICLRLPALLAMFNASYPASFRAAVSHASRGKELGQVAAVRFQHFSQQLLRDSDGRNERMMSHRLQRQAAVAGYGCFDRERFVRFDGMDEPFGLRGDGRQLERNGTLGGNEAVDLDASVVREEIQDAVVRHVQRLHVAGAVVERAHEVDGSFGIIGAAPLLQLLRLLAQVGILVQVEQLGLYALHYLGTVAVFAQGFLLLGKHGIRHVVVFEIVGRQRTKSLDKGGVPFPGCDVGGGEGIVAAQQLRQAVDAVDLGAADPVKMIEADELGVDPVRRRAVFAGKPLEQADRSVAQSDAADRGMLVDGLGHHAGRVGEVEQPRLRRQLFDIPANIQQHRNRAQRLHHASGAGRLLTDDSVFERNRLILAARLQHAYPHLRAYEVGTGDGEPAVRRQMDFDRKA
ncbi:hypothetical protein BN871_AJ_00770 [Paenibacillus sp. P22]|nr:hypothetical protein BN871_AJ_00770 [Paenibacillus sp. P22]